MATNKDRREGGLQFQGKLKKQDSADQPLVTIITVVFNGDSHIERTIESVLGQSYGNIEYIIIDGASTDKTLNIIEKYSDQIDYWLSEADEGLYYAMNKGIELANGQMIGILNSGDLYLKESVQNIVDANKKEVGDVFFGDWNVITEEDGSCSFTREYSDIKQMHYKQTIGHPTCFVTKEIYNRLQAFDTQYKLAADYDFLLRCMKNNLRLMNLPKVIVACSPGGLSNSYKSDFEAFQIQRAHKLPNPYKYIYRGVKAYFKSLIKKVLPLQKKASA